MTSKKRLEKLERDIASLYQLFKTQTELNHFYDEGIREVRRENNRVWVLIMVVSILVVWLVLYVFRTIG